MVSVISVKRAGHILVAIAVAAIFAASVQSCIARRNEFAGYPTASGLPSIPGDVRALLVDGAQCRVSVTAGYKVIAGGTTLFSDRRPMPEVVVKPQGGGIALGARRVEHRRVEIVPAIDGSLRVNGGAYHGRLLLVRRPSRRPDRRAPDGSARLLAVNVLPWNDYLAGVVSSEMPSYWPMEALKAQAIAARTYVLCRARSRAGWDYDVAAGTGDQVYKGIAGETASARAAVDQTRGVVLLYDWKILPAYYHAACGGRTANRRTVFGEEDITPLSGVSCPYCNPRLHRPRGPKYYRWEAAVPEAELATALASKGYELAGIEAISPAVDAGGHASEVTVAPAAGAPFRLGVDELRSLVGYGKIVSNCFECEKRGTTFLFRGRGFGHGVGMCQWGARGMAISGYGSKAILHYYYPGAEIRRVY